MASIIEANTGKKSKRGRSVKYPFNEMKRGDSFFWDNILITQISPAARAYGKRNKMTFSCATENKGVRVSRIK